MKTLQAGNHGQANSLCKQANSLPLPLPLSPSLPLSHSLPPSPSFPLSLSESYQQEIECPNKRFKRTLAQDVHLTQPRAQAPGQQPGHRNVADHDDDPNIPTNKLLYAFSSLNENV